MLTVENLGVNYGNMRAVRELSFSIEAGEFVAVLGANGAGKSTTLKALMGLLPTRTGRVLFGGADITSLPTPRRIQAGLALVPEGRQVFPGLTVGENLELAYFASHPKERGRQRYDQLVGEMFTLFPKLKERIAQKAGSLSGGEQQMVALARGLLSEPKLLALDEPSLGLAPVIVDQVLDVLVQLNRGGLAIIMVEQDAHRALEVAQRAYVMETGSITLSGSSSELRSSKAVQEAFLGTAVSEGSL